MAKVKYFQYLNMQTILYRQKVNMSERKKEDRDIVRGGGQGERSLCSKADKHLLYLYNNDMFNFIT